MKFLSTFLSLLLIGCGSEPKKGVISPNIPPCELSIVFSGDYMQHGPQVRAARVEGGFDYTTQLKHIEHIWKGSEYSVINLETTLSPTAPYTGYPLFRSPSDIASTLKEVGITHIALANNHTVDRGLKGVEYTIDALRSAELEYFGVGLGDTISKLYTFIDHPPFKVALLNATYGTNGMPVHSAIEMNSSLDTSLLFSTIESVKAQGATHTIAYLHWGNEYQLAPSREQKQLAMELKERGVDIVIGSHPHVAQPIDFENSIVYSLGNFVSNQRKPYTDSGYSVKVTLTAGSSTPKIRPIAHYVDISEGGVDKYRVLRLRDTALIASKDIRDKMVKAIERTNNVIHRTVKYD